MEHKTTEMLAGTHLPEGETKIYRPPSNLVFKLSEEELRQIIPAYTAGKRMRLLKSWTSVFRAHLSKITPYTTWVFTDSSVSSELMRTTTLFKASGRCGAAYCNASIQMRANKNDRQTVHCQISGEDNAWQLTHAAASVHCICVTCTCITILVSY